mgnify:CR=1 FL=1
MNVENALMGIIQAEQKIYFPSSFTSRKFDTYGARDGLRRISKSFRFALNVEMTSFSFPRSQKTEQTVIPTNGRDLCNPSGLRSDAICYTSKRNSKSRCHPDRRLLPNFFLKFEDPRLPSLWSPRGGQARKIEQIRNLLFFGMSVSRSKGGTSAVRHRTA